MKPTMALKPLVFALAAVMAMAAQAGGNDHGNGHGNGHGNHEPKGPTLEQLLQIGAGAGAAVLDTQNSDGNLVGNQGTKNDANVNNSANGTNGNVGMNNTAGDGNQQDNAAALATADESFIFGSAVSVSSATQVNNNNAVANYSTTNNANLNNVGNGGSGNIGVNNSAGNFNQQKNNLAIAVSGGRVANAAAAANQSSTGLTVSNNGTQTYKKIPSPAPWPPSARSLPLARLPSKVIKATAVAAMVTTIAAMAVTAAAKIRKPPSKLSVSSAWLASPLNKC